jgi:hypothetical protein
MIWVGDKVVRFTVFWGDDGPKDVESQLRSIENQIKKLDNVLSSCDLRGKGWAKATSKS